MSISNPTYFAFPITTDRYALGFAYQTWAWFYPVFFENPAGVESLSLHNQKPLFVIYLPELSALGEITPIPESLLEDIPASENQSIQIVFDPESQSFQTEVHTTEGINSRPSTQQESLAYCDLIACQSLDLPGLKLRLLETSLGFVPSFQYKIEQVYRDFFAPYRKVLKDQKADFPTQQRKKVFAKAFMEQILPVAEAHGFKRHTKTSNRLTKELENGLSVFIFFEYIGFGSGGYAAQIYYYEESAGNFENEQYFAHIMPYFPHSTNILIDARSAEILQIEIQYWIRTMELYVFPFIQRHATHQQILSNVKHMEKVEQYRQAWGISPQHRKPAYYFDFPLNRSAECLAALENKDK